MIYNTLKMARRLEAGSFTQEQAITLTEAISESTEDVVATKADLIDLENRLIKWIVGAIAFNLFGTAGLVLALVKIVR